MSLSRVKKEVQLLCSVQIPEHTRWKLPSRSCKRQSARYWRDVSEIYPLRTATALYIQPLTLTGSQKTLRNFIKSWLNYLLALTVSSELVDIQTTVTGSLWDWGKLKNMMFLRQVLHMWGASLLISQQIYGRVFVCKSHWTQICVSRLCVVQDQNKHDALLSGSRRPVGDNDVGSALRPFQPRGELHFITSLTELPVAPSVPPVDWPLRTCLNLSSAAAWPPYVQTNQTGTSSALKLVKNFNRTWFLSYVFSTKTYRSVFGSTVIPFISFRQSYLK